MGRECGNHILDLMLMNIEWLDRQPAGSGMMLLPGFFMPATNHLRHGQTAVIVDRKGAESSLKC